MSDRHTAEKINSTSELGRNFVKDVHLTLRQMKQFEIYNRSQLPFFLVDCEVKNIATNLQMNILIEVFVRAVNYLFTTENPIPDHVLFSTSVD